MKKEFSAMILAAGFGKRMLSLTDQIPKPLIEINKVSLLKNCIDFLFLIGCKKIVINTHYKHNLIFDFINNFYPSFNIEISYEENLLDTAGGVKNAIKKFDDKNILVINSDVYLKKENESDVIELVDNYDTNDLCKLLLVDKKKAYGIINKKADFSIKNNLIKRWENDNQELYFSGLQMLSLNVLNNFDLKKFSFNLVWDYLIKRNSLYGQLMVSQLYHVGDENGLNKAINSNT